MRESTPFSPAGQAKAERILRLAQQAGRRRRWRRRCLQATPIVLLLLATVLRRPPASPTAPTPIATTPPLVVKVPLVRIERIMTDPTISDRLRMPTIEPHWERLTDDRLLDLLAEARHPAAIAYEDGRAKLVYIEPQ